MEPGQSVATQDDIDWAYRLGAHGICGMCGAVGGDPHQPACSESWRRLILSYGETRWAEGDRVDANDPATPG